LGQGPLLSYALDPARATELMVQGTGQSHPVPEPGPSV